MNPKTRAIIESALSMPRTIPSMAKTCDLSEPTLRLNVPKLAHIIDWKRSKNKFLALWELGPGNNAPCLLKPYTPAQRTARYKATRKRRDPFVAALFGTVPYRTKPNTITQHTTKPDPTTPSKTVGNSTTQYSSYRRSLHYKF